MSYLRLNKLHSVVQDGHGVFKQEEPDASLADKNAEIFAYFSQFLDDK